MLPILFACGKEDKALSGHPDTISVDGAGYSRAVYEAGAILIPDKQAVLSGALHPYFLGFDMLVSNAESHPGGVLTTDIDGPVYILAPATPVPPGWLVVGNSTAGDEACTCVSDGQVINLAIFSKKATAGAKVKIPELSGTLSAIPLARRINWKQEDRGNSALAVNEIQVSGGRLVDVRAVKKGQKAFPQNDNYLFGDDAVNAADGCSNCAVGLVEQRGVTAFRCGADERPLIALECETVEGWTSLDKSFSLGELNYHLFTLPGYKAGTWVEVPYPAGCTHSGFVFGNVISVVEQPEFGDVVISEVARLRNGTISNVCITKLPDGSLLSACTGGKDGSGLVMYRSTDHGESWQRYGNYSSKINLIENYTNLFVHRGDVYLMGVAAGRVGLRISKSTDGGLNWSIPEDEESGYLLEGTYHTAQVPCIVSKGRIWRACETYSDDDSFKAPFVLSAPEDADLLKAENWTVTNTINNTSYYIGADRISSMIEGNVVEAPDGSVVNIIRSNSAASSNYATILHVSDSTGLAFDSSSDWVAMPGGGKKFTVRYDEQSRLYWSLTNPHTEGDFRHDGIYSGGLQNSLRRNRLVLISSPDLREWTIRCDVIYDPDPFFHGFQYADWVVDGDDLAVVVRAAYPEYRGLPVRQHDANKFIFVKVKGFRNK